MAKYIEIIGSRQGVKTLRRTKSFLSSGIHVNSSRIDPPTWWPCHVVANQEIGTIDNPGQTPLP